MLPPILLITRSSSFTSAVGASRISFSQMVFRKNSPQDIPAFFAFAARSSRSALDRRNSKRLSYTSISLFISLLLYNHNFDICTCVFNISAEFRFISDNAQIIYHKQQPFVFGAVGSNIHLAIRNLSFEQVGLGVSHLWLRLSPPLWNVSDVCLFSFQRLMKDFHSCE